MLKLESYWMKNITKTYTVTKQKANITILSSRLKKTIFFLSNEERPKLIVKRVINSNLRVRITKQTKNEQIYLWTQ